MSRSSVVASFVMVVFEESCDCVACVYSVFTCISIIRGCARPCTVLSSLGFTRAFTVDVVWVDPCVSCLVSFFSRLLLPSTLLLLSSMYV